MLLCCFISRLSAQDVDEVIDKTIIHKEWNLVAFLNTSGGGAGFQYGWTPTYYDKHFWEIDFLYSTNLKQVRVRNQIYPNAKSFYYGKLYDLYFLRGGYGYQRTIHQKPYWGGVRIRYTLSAGFTLGMGLPKYVRVQNWGSTGPMESTDERYDPTQHTADNIIGRGRYFAGIRYTALRPGFYAKTGLNFDFSKDERKMHALEIGVTLDMIFPPIQDMAYNKAKPIFICGYIAYCFGKRKGAYE
jgi:hypothetical protein